MQAFLERNSNDGFALADGNDFRLIEWASRTSPCQKQITNMDEARASEKQIEIMLEPIKSLMTGHLSIPGNK
uniref:Uncharacterized protein n=1 Tax=Angiostrongylus cantonensis TaxID=6313 RepID=A0A0K0DL28_ANGCA